MNVMECIEKRVSVRDYKKIPVEQEKLDAITEAMRLAPSAGNCQKWLFYVVTGEEAKKGLAAATEFPWVADAGAVIAAIGTEKNVMTNGQRLDSIDLSIAAAFGVLEATDLGLGTCWLAHYLDEDVRRVLGLPDTCSVVALITVGYAVKTPEGHMRKSREDVVRTI
jgi:nitroreductase